MVYKTHRTVIHSEKVPHEFHPALEDAKTLFVVEQKNLVPNYAPSGIMNSVDMYTREVERGGSKLDLHNATRQIDVVRGNLHNIAYGTWSRRECSLFSTGLLYSDFSTSPNQGISIPDDPRFDIALHVTELPIGYSGRLLEDQHKVIYQEELVFSPTIYDVLSFAFSLSPFQVYAQNAQGETKLLYHNDEFLEEPITNPNPPQRTKPKTFVLYEEDAQESYASDVSVLPFDSSLKPTHSEEVAALLPLVDYALVGHSFESLESLVAYTNHTNHNHLLWKIHNTQRKEGDPNCALLDLEKKHGMRTGKTELPEYKNRISLDCGFATIRFGNCYIAIGKGGAFESLFLLENHIRDIWVDPSQYNSKCSPDAWNIIFDRSRGITPATKVLVDSIEERSAYPVQK